MIVALLIKKNPREREQMLFKSFLLRLALEYN